MATKSIGKAQRKRRRRGAAARPGRPGEIHDGRPPIGRSRARPTAARARPAEAPDSKTRKPGQGQAGAKAPAH